MPITVRCPICRKTFSAPDTAEGRESKCRFCGEPFTLRSFTAEDAAFNPVELIGNPPSPPARVETKPAPPQRARPASPVVDKFPNLAATLLTMRGAVDLCFFVILGLAVLAPVATFIQSVMAVTEQMSDAPFWVRFTGGLFLGLMAGLYNLFLVACVALLVLVVAYVARVILMAIIELAGVLVEIEKNTRP